MCLISVGVKDMLTMVSEQNHISTMIHCETQIAPCTRPCQRILTTSIPEIVNSTLGKVKWQNGDLVLIGES